MSSYIEPPVYLARTLVAQHNLALDVTLKFSMSVLGSSRTWPSQIPGTAHDVDCRLELDFPNVPTGSRLYRTLDSKRLSSVRIELRRWVTKIIWQSLHVQDVTFGTYYSQESGTMKLIPPRGFPARKKERQREQMVASSKIQTLLHLNQEALFNEPDITPNTYGVSWFDAALIN